MKVIIVGTADHIRTGLGAHLMTRGHEVLTYETGEAALLQVENYDADVILIDSTLPDMEPTAVATHLRHWTPNSNVPVLILKEDKNSSTSVARRVSSPFADHTGHHAPFLA